MSNKVTYKLDGKEVSLQEFQAGGKDNWLDGPPMTANTYTEHDPLISDGLGCMKSQVPEMREAIKRHGIQGVQVKDNGQLVITSRRGRKEVGLMRPIPLHDADGGYGD